MFLLSFAIFIYFIFHQDFGKGQHPVVFEFDRWLDVYKRNLLECYIFLYFSSWKTHHLVFHVLRTNFPEYIGLESIQAQLFIILLTLLEK